MTILIFIAGVLTGLLIFYWLPALRPFIRDKLLPSIRTNWKQWRNKEN